MGRWEARQSSLFESQPQAAELPEPLRRKVLLLLESLLTEALAIQSACADPERPREGSDDQVTYPMGTNGILVGQSGTFNFTTDPRLPELVSECSPFDSCTGNAAFEAPPSLPLVEAKIAGSLVIPGALGTALGANLNPSACGSHRLLQITTTALRSSVSACPAVSTCDETGYEALITAIGSAGDGYE